MEIFYQTVNVSTINLPYEKSIIPRLESMLAFVQKTDMGVEGVCRRLIGRVHDLEERKD